MIIIFNKILPPKGFAAINLFTLLFVKKGVKITDRLINHEKIHSAQMKEMLFIFFYIVYVCEWLVRLVVNRGDAYSNISFEREAFDNDNNLDYLKTRKWYSWSKYMRIKHISK